MKAYFYLALLSLVSMCGCGPSNDADKSSGQASSCHYFIVVRSVKRSSSAVKVDTVPEKQAHDIGKLKNYIGRDVGTVAFDFSVNFADDAYEKSGIFRKIRRNYSGTAHIYSPTGELWRLYFKRGKFIKLRSTGRIDKTKILRSVNIKNGKTDIPSTEFKGLKSIKIPALRFKSENRIIETGTCSVSKKGR